VTSSQRIFTHKGGFFSQVLKDSEVGLGVVGDNLFSILPKILDWKSVLDTIGDALVRKYSTILTYRYFHYIR
jgi:hypothetical protein